jgi:hypothetical protein
MKFTCTKTFALIISLFLSVDLFARDYLIFSVTQDLPMGHENELIRKNYYVNIGENQGVQKGTLLSVFRVISKANPYDNKKRVNYKIPIGKLEVLHVENDSAVAMTKELFESVNDPVFEISNFMIGDHVSVNVK